MYDLLPVQYTFVKNGERKVVPGCTVVGDGGGRWGGADQVGWRAPVGCRTGGTGGTGGTAAPRTVGTGEPLTGFGTRVRNSRSGNPKHAVIKLIISF